MRIDIVPRSQQTVSLSSLIAAGPAVVGLAHRLGQRRRLVRSPQTSCRYGIGESKMLMPLEAGPSLGQPVLHCGVAGSSAAAGNDQDRAIRKVEQMLTELSTDVVMQRAGPSCADGDDGCVAVSGE